MINFLEKLIGWLTRWKTGLEKREAELELGAQRSSRWRSVRNEYLRTHKVCAVCGGDNDLDVHHRIPFHKDPSLELEPNNFITLCTPHHFLVGHLMSWRSWNSEVDRDASDWRLKIISRP